MIHRRYRRDRRSGHERAFVRQAGVVKHHALLPCGNHRLVSYSSAASSSKRIRRLRFRGNERGLHLHSTSATNGNKGACAVYFLFFGCRFVEQPHFPFPFFHITNPPVSMLAIGSALSAAWVLYDRGRAAANAAAQLSKWLTSISPEVDFETLASLSRLLERADLRISAIRPALNFLLLWSRDKGTCVHGLVFMTREVLLRVENLIQTCLAERADGPVVSLSSSSTGISSSTAAPVSSSSAAASSGAASSSDADDPVTLRNNRLRALLVALQVPALFSHVRFTSEPASFFPSSDAVLMLFSINFWFNFASPSGCISYDFAISPDPPLVIITIFVCCLFFCRVTCRSSTLASTRFRSL